MYISQLPKYITTELLIVTIVTVAGIAIITVYIFIHHIISTTINRRTGSLFQSVKGNFQIFIHAYTGKYYLQ